MSKYSFYVKPIFLILFIFFINIAFKPEKNNPVIIIGNTRFTVISSMCIRIEFAENQNFVDDKTFFAENRNAIYSDFDLVKNEDEVIIKTNNIKLNYRPDGKRFTKENLKAWIKNGNSEVEWYPGKTNEKNLGGTLPTLDGVDHDIKVNDGLLSRDGWYLIDDTNRKLLKNDWVSERSFDSKTDWYLFGYGTEFKEALKTFVDISGNVPLVRKHVLGSWYCRWYDYSAEEFRQLVKEYQDHDFPLDIMVMDMGWHTQKYATSGFGHHELFGSDNQPVWKGWTGFTWNKELIPDPAGLLNDFKKDNIYVTLNVHPHDGIRDHEAMYPEFMKALGKDPAKKEYLPFNAGDKACMDAYFKYAHNNSQEYFFGDNILSAPIVSPGNGPGKLAKQKIWFPNGIWYNIFSNKKFSGEKTDSVTSDLNEFPLYVRGGTPIPMQPYSQRMTSEAAKNIIIRCYPGKIGDDNHFDLYEDDGQTKEYEQGKYAITTLKYKRKKTSTIITIIGTKGEFQGQLKTRKYQIELASTKKATKAFFDGKRVKVQYDSENFKNIISIPNTSIKENHSIEIFALDADQYEITKIPESSKY